MKWGREEERTGTYKRASQAEMGYLMEKEQTEKARPGQASHPETLSLFAWLLPDEFSNRQKGEGGPGGVCLVSLGRSN